MDGTHNPTEAVPPAPGQPEPGEPGAPADQVHAQDYQFHFDGNGSEYFRIWIVNILLSVATLGIYSAWAKVRTNRYIYGNTHVADGHFDYHADPMTILRGRIVAIVLLLVYTVATSYLPVVSAIFIILLLVAMPFVVVRALTFNARMSSWRNVRFNFVGTPGGAFGAYLGWPLLGLLTFGLAMPYAWFRQALFGVDNHQLGGTPFKLSAEASGFYIIVLILFVYGMGVSVLFAIFAGVLGEAVVIVTPFLFLAYFIAFSLFSALHFQLIYKDLRLGDNTINTNVNIASYLKIATVNGLLMAVTLGLYYPWAKIRMTRYLLESLHLEAVNVDGFVNQAREEQSAFGEEFGEAFDLGIGV